MGEVLVGGGVFNPAAGSLSVIDPRDPPGTAAQVATLPTPPYGLSFDGGRVWTLNIDGTMSIVTPAATPPWSVATLDPGFAANGIVFDGQNNWLSDPTSCSLVKLDSAGAIVQTVNLGPPNCVLYTPIFDGGNVIVPSGDALKVVQDSAGTLIATIPIGTGAAGAAFDGERILVQSTGGGQNAPRGVTVLRAADFSTLRVEGFGPFGGPGIYNVASDGLNFWLIVQTGDGSFLARMSRLPRKLFALPLALAALLAGGATRIVQDQCGPFTDVTPGFCPYILEIYYLGITVGTSPTTFSPDDPLTRGQGAVFIAKGVNQTLARSSRRAALGQWWTTTPQWGDRIGTTAVGIFPIGIASDGADLWVANQAGQHGLAGACERWKAPRHLDGGRPGFSDVRARGHGQGVRDRRLRARDPLHDRSEPARGPLGAGRDRRNHTVRNRVRRVSDLDSERRARSRS